MSLSGKTFILNFSDTIAAIATATGPSGISIIRISGDNAIILADKIFSGKIKPSRAQTHTVHYGKIIDPTTKNLLDEVMLTILLAPNTYTGENMVEISCHGGDYIASSILALINKLGARLAEPGEFTKRRVLNGKMDITQAEAILDLVQVKNEASFHSAIAQLQGKLSGYIEGLSDELKAILAQMENLLEFEEDQKQTAKAFRRFTDRIENLSSDIAGKINKNEQLKFMRNGVECVIIGRPNVGKSSLFNRLSEMDKAIVTEIPGTTRDSIEQTVAINGIIFHLIDTAGLKDITASKGTQKIEAMGIERSKNWLQTADVVLAVFDNSARMNKEDRLVYEATKTKARLIVLNKIDLKPRFNLNFFKHETIYPISAKFNRGINRLKTAMTKMYKKQLPIGSNNYLYLNTRHIDTLNQVVDLLRQCVKENYLETSIMHLRNALDVLGNVTSAVTNEQILDTIFSQFCIGK